MAETIWILHDYIPAKVNGFLPITLSLVTLSLASALDRTPGADPAYL